jgi:ABC-type nitrate/sulfonate/bicarbonate transport system permease component
MRRRILVVVLELAVPAGLFGGWWLWSTSANSLYFPPLPKILHAFREEWLFSRLHDIGSSLENLAIGLVLAAVVGIALGTILGLVPVLREATAPVVEFYRSVPGAAVLPMFILFFGIERQMRVSVIVFGTVWPILLNTIDGVRSIDSVTRDMARSYRIPRLVRLFGVVLPAASPQIVTGLRVALSVGVTVMVFSELVGSPEGIGAALFQFEQTFRIPEMWSAMLLLGILGYFLNVGFRGIEHRVLHWHRGMRDAGGS